MMCRATLDRLVPACAATVHTPSSRVNVTSFEVQRQVWRGERDLFDFHWPVPVIAVARNPQRMYHVPHHSSPGGNGPRLEFLRPRIEPYDRVRLRVRFAVPYDSVHDRDSVGLRLWPTRRWPFRYRARLGIESPQHIGHLARVPHRTIWGVHRIVRP